MSSQADPAKEAAIASARLTDCCGNKAWRGHFCSYHQGFEDGYDAALEALKEQS
jgi:hypothetical protein